MIAPRDQLSEIAQYFYTRGWMLGTAGNLSVRNADGSIWITASGQNKGSLAREHFLLLDSTGAKLHDSPLKPSAETSIHTTIYQKFPHVHACLHVHMLESHWVCEHLIGDRMPLARIEMLKGFGWKAEDEIPELLVIDNHPHVPDIAHELNQPLAAISNYAHAAQRFAQSLALDRIDQDGDIRAALEQIASQALRAGEIIRRLRGLVQNRNTQKEPSDLNHLLQEVIGFVQSEIRLREIKISLEIDPKLPSAPLDRIQIQQVLLNLLRNAIEALENVPPGTRRILVRTQSLPQSDHIRFVISDSGPGVPADILPTIFDPFCTSKSTGTGLGLAISRTIAEAHHGKLTYEHAPGGGAQFVLSLPHSHPGGSL